jgi:hypothetical protein
MKVTKDHMLFEMVFKRLKKFRIEFHMKWWFLCDAIEIYVTS